MWHETRFVNGLFLDRRGKNVDLRLRPVRFHQFAIGKGSGLQIPVLEDLMGRKASTWWARFAIRGTDAKFEVHYSEPDEAQGPNKTIRSVHAGSPGFFGEILVVKVVRFRLVEMVDTDLDFALRASKATLDFWRDHPHTIPDRDIVI